MIGTWISLFSYVRGNIVLALDNKTKLFSECYVKAEIENVMQLNRHIDLEVCHLQTTWYRILLVMPVRLTHLDVIAIGH